MHPPTALGDVDFILDPAVAEDLQHEAADGKGRCVTAPYWTIRRAGVDDPTELAVAVSEDFAAHPEYKSSADTARALRLQLYKRLLPTVGEDIALGLVKELMTMEGA